MRTQSFMASPMAALALVLVVDRNACGHRAGALFADSFDPSGCNSNMTRPERPDRRPARRRPGILGSAPAGRGFPGFGGPALGRPGRPTQAHAAIRPGPCFSAKWASAATPRSSSIPRSIITGRPTWLGARRYRPPVLGPSRGRVRGLEEAGRPLSQDYPKIKPVELRMARGDGPRRPGHPGRCQEPELRRRPSSWTSGRPSFIPARRARWKRKGHITGALHHLLGGRPQRNGTWKHVEVLEKSLRGQGGHSGEDDHRLLRPGADGFARLRHPEIRPGLSRRSKITTAASTNGATSIACRSKWSGEIERYLRRVRCSRNSKNSP